MWKILFYLPRKLLSRALGFLVYLPGPGWFWEPIIRVFAELYRINLAEAEKPVGAYRSLGEFFIRRLKPGARPIANEAKLVHCADSEILEHGVIPQGGFCVQAKGKGYRIEDLLLDSSWFQRFEGGYFVHYYLCPTDYHRVHSPTDGFIQKVTYVPGDLWPVHPKALAHIDGLYAVNERVIVDFATPLGPVTAVFVGATNVGSIEITALPEFRSNRGGTFMEKKFDFGVEIKKGEELGCFRMGSTVLLFLPKDVVKRFGGNLVLPRKPRVNSALLKETKS